MRLVTALFGKGLTDEQRQLIYEEAGIDQTPDFIREEDMFRSFSEIYTEDAREEGIEQEDIQHLRSIVKKGFTIEAAMALLEIPLEKQSYYRQMLTSSQVDDDASE